MIAVFIVSLRLTKMGKNKIAILDLGTNTFHLMIASLTERGCQIVLKEKSYVKIGEDGISRGIITKPAKSRAIKAVEWFAEILKDYSVEEVIAYGTSALRNAANGRALIRDIYNATGIRINLLSGSQEAKYIYRGVRQAVDLGDSISLIMDIGGGSVEFILGNAHTILWKKSFEIGAQRLLDKFHRSDPVTRNDLTRLNHYLEQELKPLVTAVETARPKTLIGSSGTFDTLSDIYALKKNFRKDPARTERVIPMKAFLEIHEEIVIRSREERLAMPGMAEMRADMIVMASSLVHFAVTRLGITRMKASSYSLQEGILFSLIDDRRQAGLLSA